MKVLFIVEKECESEADFQDFGKEVTEFFGEPLPAWVAVSEARTAVLAAIGIEDQQPDERPLGATYWNGELLDPPARRCTVKVTDTGAFPHYWARDAHLVGTVVSAVEVTYGSETFFLFDGDGSGWFKVTEGRGSPAYGHKNIDVEGEVTYK